MEPFLDAMEMEGMMACSDGKRTRVSGVETVRASSVKRDPADTTKLIVRDRPVPRVDWGNAVNGDFHGRGDEVQWTDPYPSPLICRYSVVEE